MKLRHPMRLIITTLLVATATFSFMRKAVDKPLNTTPVANQLQSVQAQADELAFALNEDLDALKARQRAYELARQAGTDSVWVDYAWDKSVEYHVDPLLTLAVIEQESGWNAKAVNVNSDSSRDYGIFQINERTWPSLAKALNLTDPLDPRQNIKAGVYRLAYLSRQYETTAAVLTSYNRGEEGLRKWYVSRGTVRSPYSDEVERRMFR